jgi:CRISPR-associated protein Csx14
MKKILIAVCGLSPQIITETLFALHQQDRLPDMVRILTTRIGMEACHAQLFAAGNGHYHKFLADYQIAADSIDFSPLDVIAVTDEQGRCIDDIGDEDDNLAFLHACMLHAYEYSKSPESRIFYSIAGGRKTMGACLASAAQLYGRQQDRIFHVLVSPEFENCREFYYPAMPSRPITLFDEKQHPYQNPLKNQFHEHKA